MLAELLQRGGYPTGGPVSMYGQSKPEVTRSAEASNRVNLYGRQGMQQLTTKGYVLSCNQQQQQQLCTLDESMQQVLRNSPVLTQPSKIKSGRLKEWWLVSLCCQHCKSLS